MTAADGEKESMLMKNAFYIKEKLNPDMQAQT